MIVRCNWCFWKGKEEELSIITVDDEEVESCPNCGKTDCLMDMEEE